MHTKNKQETASGKPELPRLEQIMAERNILLAALQRIGNSTVAWRDEEANALIEGIGIVANNAVNQVFQMEGMNQ